MTWKFIFPLASVVFSQVTSVQFRWQVVSESTFWFKFEKQNCQRSKSRPWTYQLDHVPMNESHRKAKQMETGKQKDQNSALTQPEELQIIILWFEYTIWDYNICNISYLIFFLFIFSEDETSCLYRRCLETCLQTGQHHLSLPLFSSLLNLFNIWWHDSQHQTKWTVWMGKLWWWSTKPSTDVWNSEKFPIVSTEICNMLMRTFLSIFMKMLLQLRTILFFH